VDPSGNQCQAAKDRLAASTSKGKNETKTSTKLAAHQDSSSKGSGGDASETYYRTMSHEDYDKLRMTGELQPTGETFISPTQSFSEDYSGITVEIKVNKGTTSQLEIIGAKNDSNITNSTYPNMPYVDKGWTINNAQFKGEGDQINIGLGKGKGLEIFNSNIIDFNKVGGN
ncbi:hypothetical protein CG709_16320, partial [Lachnotalea glycerini]